MDLISIRETLNQITNELLDGYTTLLQENSELKGSMSETSSTLTQSIKHLSKEIEEKDKEIIRLMRTNHDYEVIINNLQEELTNEKSS